MRFFALLSSLIVALAVPVTAAPAAPPQFEVLFSGVLDIADVGTIDGPLGTRLHAVFNSANLTDPSGKMVATFLPTVDNGLISTSGIFYPDVVVTLRWQVDGKLAYLRTTGVGGPFNDLSFTHLETDSETWSGLNGRFLLTNVSGSTDAPIYTVFGAI